MTEGGLAIRRAEALSAAEVEALADLLVAVVAGGASVGFLPPLSREAARAYWRQACRPGVVLALAEADGRIAGTVQVHDAESANGRHRAEIAKLLVHPEMRRRGIGRALLARAEAEAAAVAKTLLVLDTREGDPSNDLYRASGWTEAGRIPDWARSADGTLAPTVFWFKRVGNHSDGNALPCRESVGGRLATGRTTERSVAPDGMKERRDVGRSRAAEVGAGAAQGGSRGAQGAA